MNNHRADGRNSKLEYPYELKIAIWHLRTGEERQLQRIQAAWASDHPVVQDAIKSKEATFCKLDRIVKDKRLGGVWPEVERLLQTDQPFDPLDLINGDLLRLYEGLLLQMVYGPPSLIKTPPNERQRQWDNVVAKAKALKRAAEETNEIGFWNIGGIAKLSRYLPMEAIEELPSLSEFLVLLQEMIERGPFDYREPEVYKLAPSYECNRLKKGAAEQLFLWRILASCFAKHCNKVPYGIIAALTQVALETDCINPETIRRDIQRHRTVIEADISS